jgi:hypothetical protein
MAEYQIVGDKKDLGRNVTTPPTHTGPNPNAQIVGDSVPLSRTPVYPPTHTAKQGMVQMVGDAVPLGRNAEAPWAQSNIPRSTTADEPAGRGSK